MKTIEISARKIVSIGKDEFSEYEMKDLASLVFNLFVYSYEIGSYEGSGFAAWTADEKDWYYHERGHCSCNGPTENINQSAKVPVTLEQLEEIANKGYGDYGKEVVAYIKKNV
jgi:hypothetical protein